MLALTAVSAIVGGRLWSLVTWWAEDPDGVRWALNPLEPAGYASAGAFVGAGITLIVARRLFGREAFRGLLDAVAPAALCALALARIGCVFEGCDPGRPSETFGVVDPDGARLMPFGAYLGVGTLVVVLVASRFRGAPGRRAAMVVVGYGVVRFAAEFTRDAPTLFHVGHVLALAVGGVAAAWWAADGRA